MTVYRSRACRRHPYSLLRAAVIAAAVGTVVWAAIVVAYLLAV